MHMIPIVSFSYDKVTLPNDPPMENGTSPQAEAADSSEE